MNKKIGLVLLSLMPSFVFASPGFSLTFGEAFFIENFMTIFMSFFVIYPIAKACAKYGEVKSLFIKLFVIRYALLIFFDLFITPNVAIWDFALVFIGTFIIAPLVTIISRKSAATSSVVTSQNSTVFQKSNVKLACANCKTEIFEEDKFCPNCGIAMEGNNVELIAPEKHIVTPSNFDDIYNLPEEQMLERFLQNEIEKAEIDNNTKLIPKDAVKRKNIMFIILSLLTFVFISLIFFHVGAIYWAIALIIIFIFYKKANSYNLVKFLKKEVKSRPQENISNIVMNVKLTFIKDSSKKVLIGGLIAALLISSIVYLKPHVLYEKSENGYTVRFYTIGLTNFTSVDIPDKHKGQDVVGIRGQVFKNMYALKTVNLPNSITEIRGQAFENDKMLKTINIPSNLTYLGGSAFKNCKSIESIVLPDGLTYIGGEAFQNARSLKSITLPAKLEEIKGNTFENNKKLQEIKIPDTVTRIGGHAFYGCSKLSKVEISENSQLNEIGSSAFRLCHSLMEITVPAKTYVNSKAFKESPTTVKKYGQIEYGSLVNKNKHKYYTSKYIRVGNTERINGYNTGSIIYQTKATLTLKSINVTADGSEFTIEYKDSTTTKEFKLNRTVPNMEINESIDVEVSASYYFSSSTSISLNVYYD